MYNIELDFTNMMSDALGIKSGITDGQLVDFSPKAKRALNRIKKENKEGTLGFMHLPRADTEPITKLAASVRENDIEDFVVLGIGGSALGTRAITEALLHPSWNVFSASRRRGRPRIFVLDNIDPTTVVSVLDTVNIKKTIFNVVSKSGQTTETLAQLLIVKELVKKAVDTRWPEHFVFTTDPEEGPLRKLAEEYSIPTLDIPPSVGGRFSALSPVGLFPAAVCGIDIKELLSGACDMTSLCLDNNLKNNISSTLCAYYYIHYGRGRHITVLMPYSDRLRALGDWFSQLWAESLGKRKSKSNTVGLTPVVAVGATDQHSQLQLYLDGPANKTLTFIRVADHHSDMTIPASLEHEAFSPLEGGSLNGLLTAEFEATRDTLAHSGVPNVTLNLSRISPETIGALMFLFEIVTTQMGYILGINPFDQPAVEDGKKKTMAILKGEVVPDTETPHKIEGVIG